MDYKCVHCACVPPFITPDSFSDHLFKLHKSLSFFRCHICLHESFDIKHLIVHYRLHMICFYQCIFCIHGTTSVKAMASHLRQSHEDNRQVFVAREFDRKMGSVFPLENLKKINLEDTDHNDSCRQTGENYETTVNDRMTHAQMEVGDPPDAETPSSSRGECLEFGYITPEELLGTGLYGQDLCICGFSGCTYRAIDISLLRSHLLVCEHKARVFLCVHCTKTFKHLEAFICHINTHSVARYGCGLCPYRRPDEQRVIAHVLKTHKINNTACDPLDPMDLNPKTARFVVRPMLVRDPFTLSNK